MCLLRRLLVCLLLSVVWGGVICGGVVCGGFVCCC